MKVVTERHFYTDSGAIIEQLQKMKELRQQKFQGAAALARTIRAHRAAFSAGQIRGFVFNEKPDLRFWVVDGRHGDLTVYAPNPKTKRGKAVIEQMEQLHIPQYEELLTGTPFDYILMWGEQIYLPGVAFYGNRLVVTAPVWVEEAAAIFEASRDDWLMRARAYNEEHMKELSEHERQVFPEFDALPQVKAVKESKLGNEDKTKDWPCPEGWNEWTEEEHRSFANDFRNMLNAEGSKH